MQFSDKKINSKIEPNHLEHTYQGKLNFVI